MLHYILTLLLCSFIPLCLSIEINHQCGGEDYNGSTISVTDPFNALIFLVGFHRAK